MILVQNWNVWVQRSGRSPFLPLTSHWIPPLSIHRQPRWERGPELQLLRPTKDVSSFRKPPQGPARQAFMNEDGDAGGAVFSLGGKAKMSSSSYSATVEAAVPGRPASEPRHEVMDEGEHLQNVQNALSSRGCLEQKNGKRLEGLKKRRVRTDGGRGKLVGVTVNKGDPRTREHLCKKGEKRSYFIYYGVIKSESPLCKQNQFCQWCNMLSLASSVFHLFSSTCLPPVFVQLFTLTLCRPLGRVEISHTAAVLHQCQHFLKLYRDDLQSLHVFRSRASKTESDGGSDIW